MCVLYFDFINCGEEGDERVHVSITVRKKAMKSHLESTVSKETILHFRHGGEFEVVTSWWCQSCGVQKFALTLTETVTNIKNC